MNEAEIGTDITARWRRAAALQSLRAAGKLLVRLEGRQLALFDTPDGVRACDNRCPHEGYPLTEGSLAGDCTLTCNWHNWKFDLRTGDNLYGGDRLRVYPVQVRGEDVWLNLAEPPYTARYSALTQSLRGAFDDHAYDRLAREIARLGKLGADPLDALRLAIVWSWQRLEFGWTHVYAGMADWLKLYDEYAGHAEHQLVCLVESVAHAAFDVLRERDYPYTAASSAFDERTFLAAVEGEDEAAAAGLIRGGLRDGLRFADFEPALSRAALAHYNDFGHSLIYVTKAGALIERLGDAVAEPLLLSLLRSLVYATREDRIPEFRGYAEALRAWGRGTEHLDAGRWRGRGINAALDLTVAASDREPAEIYRALLEANAVNLLQFDLEQEDRVQVSVSGNVGWLDFTHGITFANAVRKQCTLLPALWPQGLLQMACFAGRNAAFTRNDDLLARWRVGDPAAFVDGLIERLFDHGQGEYIVSVHWLKTTLAVREELARGLPERLADVLAAGLNRFVSSPLKRRRARRTAHQSLQFVARE